jgi:hypothetical protein
MENLPLPLHLFIHLSLAILAGGLIGRHWNKVELGVAAGLLGGFFIDLDHVLEYFLVFGPQFNLLYFLEGRQFLVSGQVHSWFHAWEYAPILFLAAWLLRRRQEVMVFILALAVGGLVHLATDSVVNQYPLRNYSVLYRQSVDFAVEKLFSPQQYQDFLANKKYLDL